MKSEYQNFNLVMLVSENVEANYINHKILESSKFSKNIVSKVSGKNALEHLKNNIDKPSLVPEFILLDISQPVNIGYHFLDELEQSFEIAQSGVRVIIVSNSLNIEEIDKILKRPQVMGYVSKPLLVEKLKTLKSSYLKAPDKKQRIN